MKILVICDDIWHPAEVVRKGLESLETDFWQFDFVGAAKDILTAEMIAEYPLIMCCKGNNVTSGNPNPWFEPGVTEVMGEQFREYVEKGGAFLSVHAGNAFSENRDGDGVREYTEFVGNCFVSHPPRCEVTLRKVKEHPVLSGVELPFVLRDEHYQIRMLAEDADIFLESVSETGGVQVAGYSREIGNGRVCVLTPGHTLSVWKDRGFQRLLLNAMEWCLQKGKAAAEE